MIQKLGFSMEIVALSRVKHALVQCTGRVENADLVDWIICEKIQMLKGNVNILVPVPEIHHTGE